jgi:dihydroorotase
LYVAERAGLSGIFDMPNTDPAITTRKLAEERLELAKQANSPVFYGLYIGLTRNPEQIKEAVKSWRDLFSATGEIAENNFGRVGIVGLKMYAGKSVGNLEIIKEEDQKTVYNTLANEGFDGVLAVHCEKESLFKPNLWNPSKPISHCYARPFNAEVESIKDQIKFSQAANFKGQLHICHVTNTDSVDLINEAKQEGRRISCGVTPHHCVLDEDSMKKKDGILYKVNPPLRRYEMKTKQSLLSILFSPVNFPTFGSSFLLYDLEGGQIDWIETDHAPHTLEEKSNAPYMSGFPGLPYYPHFINHLKKEGFSEELLFKITHSNIEEVFKIGIRPLEWKFSKNPDLSLHTEYGVDVYEDVRQK